MTTGNKTLDSTSLSGSTALDSPQRVGLKWSKNWTGDNEPPVVKVYAWVRNPVTNKWYRKRVLSKRRRDPHAYTCNVQSWSSPLTQYKDGFFPPLRQASPITAYYVPPASDPWTSNHYLDLVSKLREKIYGSGFEPGVFIAELGQTFGLVGEAAARLAASAAYLQKGNIREASRVITSYSRHPTRGARADRALAKTVLEVQYGWRPLMQDMKDGAEYIAHQLHAPLEQKYRVTRVATTSVETDSATRAGLGFASGVYETKGQLIAYLSEPPVTAALQTILHPEIIIWEKIPFSFVGDWALPIGSYLTARATASALTGKFVYTLTRRFFLSGTRALSGGSSYTKAQYYLSPPYDAYRRETWVARTVSTSLGIPLPDFKGLGKTFSMEHCLNAVSLLTSVGKKNPDDTIRGALKWLRGG